MRKVAFFDIDGTLTSEIDGSIPQSAIDSIRQARENGHLMFINTGRCAEIVDQRFRDIGWDGYVCGCGTHIIYENKDLLHNTQPHEVAFEILQAARKCNIDLEFESKEIMYFDRPETLKHPEAQSFYNYFSKGKYLMAKDINESGFTADKFVIWHTEDSDLEQFLKTSDKYFDCIDRSSYFKEFVPHGFSKATGIQFVLDHFGIPLENAYAFGDSNNDLSMLTFVPNSIAMGNSLPVSIFEKVSYKTGNASANGIRDALKHFGFI